MNKKICDSGFDNWTTDQLPDLTGKTYVITGSNTGVGFQTARHLGEKGGNIVMLCRSQTRGAEAKAKLENMVKGKVDLVQMDLSDFDTVRKAADRLCQEYPKIDALINNAGVLNTVEQYTPDGIDQRVATNHLGHFLLAGMLQEPIEAAEGRIVALSSGMHKFAPLNKDDFLMKGEHSKFDRYTQSKLSNLMFAFELDRRLQAAGRKTIAIACHPGISNTQMTRFVHNPVGKALLAMMNVVTAQAPAAGAVPGALAAAGQEAKRGAYYGPQKVWESRGPVSDAKVADHALDRETQAWLWDESERAVNFEWGLPAA